MKRSSRPSSAPVNRLMLATVLLLAFAGTIGLATVWLRHQISEVARANKQVQARTAEVERRIAETNAQIASALNPQVLISQNARLHLGLVSPAEEQIVRVDLDVETLLADNRAYAERFRRLNVGTLVPTNSTRVTAPFIATVPR